MAALNPNIITREEHMRCQEEFNNSLRKLDDKFNDYVIAQTKWMTILSETSHNTAEALAKHCNEASKIVEGYQPFINDVKAHLVTDTVMQNFHKRRYAVYASIGALTVGIIALAESLYKITLILNSLKGLHP
jgi:NifB/MoaA-like Fe-S oxidoreductase